MEDQVSGALRPKTAKRRRAGVLVVEDDDQVRAELSELLRVQGYVVTEATDGAHALSVLRRDPGIAVVLLDLWMPRMDGWTFRAEQRADAALREVPVIVLSADTGAQARAIHASAFINKPFDAAVLLSTVRRILAERAARTNGAAERVSEAVSLLVNGIGHEVANPLMALIGGLECAREGLSTLDRDPETCRPDVGQMLDLCWRIAGSLRTLRALPCPPWTREEVIDADRVVRAAIAQAGSAETTITFEGDVTARVHGDPKVVQYLYTALVRNAVEAVAVPQVPLAPIRPDVDVRLWRSAEEVVLDVSDRGAAIPDGDLARIFALEQAGRGFAWAAGLRLWFVRPVVEALGGSIEISNEADGWVRCRVRLPAAEPGPREA